MMTMQRKIEIIGFSIVLAFVAMFARGLQLEREARNRAEATVDAQTQIIAANNVAIQTRDAAAAVYAAALTRQSAAVTTPQQAAQVILRYLPTPVSPAGAPAVSQTLPTIQKSDLSTAAQQNLPAADQAAPSLTLFTPAQLESFAKQELACDATTHDLSTCAADKADLKAQLAAAEKQSQAWETVAKGGTKWHRFLGVAKNAGCAAGGAIVGSLADKQNPAIGSAIGGAAGVAGCSIF